MDLEAISFPLHTLTPSLPLSLQELLVMILQVNSTRFYRNHLLGLERPSFSVMVLQEENWRFQAMLYCSLNLGLCMLWDAVA